VNLQPLRTTAILLAFAIVGTALLALTYQVTRGAIARQEKKAKLALIGQILPAASYDNDILHDTLILPPARLLGTDAPTTTYRARLRGRPVAVVLEAIAPNGYGGKIDLLVAVKADGVINGVRVVSDHETPGLGDYIEIAKSDWIKVFDGASLAKYHGEDWQVKKDGGQFDYMTGATISPRAVVKAVHNALRYFTQNRAKLFARQALGEKR